jgi:hypothetical protein
VSFISNYLGPLFLLSVGLAAVVGALSAHIKAKRIFGIEGLEEVGKQRESALAKAVIAAGFAGIVWYDSRDLDEAVVRVAIPFGVYKFTQLLLLPIFGHLTETGNPSVVEQDVQNG